MCPLLLFCLRVTVVFFKSFLTFRLSVLLREHALMQVRKGVLPRLLEEILSTRIMVKQAMKKLAPSERIRKRVSPGFSLQ